VKDDGRGEAAVNELSDLLGCRPEEILRISAKTGLGVESVMDAVVARIPPPPPVKKDEKLRALAFDSWYDSFRGVVSLVAVFEGEVKKGAFTFSSFPSASLKLTSSRVSIIDLLPFPFCPPFPLLTAGDSITSTTTGKTYPILDLGTLSPREVSIAEHPDPAGRRLRKGMVGWVVCGMKDPKDGAPFFLCAVTQERAFC
jgi:translation elongation factor EF-4